MPSGIQNTLYINNADLEGGYFDLLIRDDDNEIMSTQKERKAAFSTFSHEVKCYNTFEHIDTSNTDKAVQKLQRKKTTKLVLAVLIAIAAVAVVTAAAAAGILLSGVNVLPIAITVLSVAALAGLITTLSLINSALHTQKDIQRTHDLNDHVIPLLNEFDESYASNESTMGSSHINSLMEYFRVKDVKTDKIFQFDDHEHVEESFQKRARNIYLDMLSRLPSDEFKSRDNRLLDDCVSQIYERSGYDPFYTTEMESLKEAYRSRCDRQIHHAWAHKVFKTAAEEICLNDNFRITEQSITLK